MTMDESKRPATTSGVRPSAALRRAPAATEPSGSR